MINLCLLEQTSYILKQQILLMLMFGSATLIKIGHRSKHMSGILGSLHSKSGIMGKVDCPRFRGTDNDANGPADESLVSHLFFAGKP